MATSGLEERVAALEQELADLRALADGRGVTLLALIEVVAQLVRERQSIGTAIEAMAEKFTRKLPADKNLRSLLRRAQAEVGRTGAGS